MTEDNLIIEIVQHLNDVCGTRYRPQSKDTQKYIRARLNEEFTLDEFRMVIEGRFAEWGNSSSMRQYLRPETLFGNKFESYLQHAILNATKPITDGRESTSKETGKSSTSFEHIAGAYTDIPD